MQVSFSIWLLGKFFGNFQSYWIATQAYLENSKFFEETPVPARVLNYATKNVITTVAMDSYIRLFIEEITEATVSRLCTRFVIVMTKVSMVTRT